MGLLLDDLGVSAYRAVSVRKLRSAYAGACLRVKRSSDNAEQDIGFSGDELDQSSLLSFCGSGSGVVTIWYDQSGAGRNWIGVSGFEPRIVNAGALHTKTFGSGTRPVVYAHTAALGFEAAVGEAFDPPATVMMVGFADDVTQDRGYYCQGVPSGGPWFYGTNASKQRQSRYGVAAVGSSTTNLTNGAIYCGGGRRNGSDYNFWLNGATDGSGTSAGASSGGDPAWLLRDASGTADMVGGLMQFVEWDSALSDADALTANQHDNTAFGTAIPSGGYTLAANAGSFIETGQDAALKFGRRVAADVGGFALSGQDAALKRGLRVAADVGALTFTGENAGLAVTRKIVADAAAYTLTGVSADLIHAGVARSLPAEAGSFGLAGADAQLIYTPANHYSLPALAGAFALSGVAADLVPDFAAHYTLVAEPGSYLLAGLEAEVLWSGLGQWTPEPSPGDPWTPGSGAGSGWIISDPTPAPWTEA